MQQLGSINLVHGFCLPRNVLSLTFELIKEFIQVSLLWCLCHRLFICVNLRGLREADLVLVASLIGKEINALGLCLLRVARRANNLQIAQGIVAAQEQRRAVVQLPRGRQ